MSDELVDVCLPVTKVTALDVMFELPLTPTTSWIGEFKWPKEVRGLKSFVNLKLARCRRFTHLFKVGSDSKDFVHEILDREDIVLAESLLDDGVRGERDALFVHLAISALVDKLTNGLQVGLAAQSSIAAP